MTKIFISLGPSSKLRKKPPSKKVRDRVPIFIASYDRVHSSMSIRFARIRLYDVSYSHETITTLPILIKQILWNEYDSLAKFLENKNTFTLEQRPKQNCKSLSNNNINIKNNIQIKFHSLYFKLISYLCLIIVCTCVSFITYNVSTL